MVVKDGRFLNIVTGPRLFCGPQMITVRQIQGGGEGINGKKNLRVKDMRPVRKRAWEAIYRADLASNTDHLQRRKGAQKGSAGRVGDNHIGEQQGRQT